MGRLRRSVLYMPADSLRKITKATTIEVDSVVMDLEDGVALNRKEEGRQSAIEACQTLDFEGRERLIRINPRGSEFVQKDLQAVAEARPDGVVLPKVESAEDLLHVDRFLSQTEAEQGLDPGSIELLALIESARGVFELPQIVAATSRLTALMFGAEDLAGDIGALRTPEGWEVFYARSAVVTAAAAFRLDAIDTLHTDFGDDEGLKSECLRGRQMGYAGKMAIHPRQVAIINEAFSPTPEEIDRATRLIQTHDAHQKQGTGAFAFEGKMVDMPMIRAAQKILQQAQAAGLLEH